MISGYFISTFGNSGCVEGYYWDTQSNALQCKICPRGTYRRIQQNDTFCIQCPDGQTSLEGSHTALQCHETRKTAH